MKNNTESPVFANTLLANVVSRDTAQKLSRLGWQQGQTAKSYHKEARCTIYNLVNKPGLKGWGWDAPNEAELLKMCKLAGCEITQNGVEAVAAELINYCKANKVKLASFNVC